MREDERITGIVKERRAEKDTVLLEPDRVQYSIVAIAVTQGGI